MLYHEQQVAALCGVHCINTLLQGPFFSELDLAQIGHELDALEREVLGAGADAAGPSTNLDESGMFSVQVLTKALQVWGLTAVPVDSQEMRQAAGGFDPQQEAAFICNLQEHWFTIRKLAGEWWNFNSLYPAPEHLSSFYLTAYLDSLKEKGYTIFVVRGPLPASPAADGGGDMDGPGKWFSPDEARAAHKTAQESRTQGRTRNRVEEALARAEAGGGSIQLRPRAVRGEDDEDADLAAAIAASMADHAGPSGAGPSTAAAAAGGGAAGPHSYAAAARRHGGGDSSDDDARLPTAMSYEEDDPELAAALAASLEEHNNTQQQQGQQQGQEQQQQQQPEQPAQAEEVAVPEEPPEGDAGALLLAFRLPSGARVSRRFGAGTSVAQVAAFVAAHMRESGELAAGARVQLATQFPKVALSDGGAALSDAGVQDKDILTVTVE